MGKRARVQHHDAVSVWERHPAQKLFCGSGFPAATIKAGSISDTPEGSRCVSRSESVLSAKDGTSAARPNFLTCLRTRKHPSSRRLKFDGLQPKEFHHRVEIPVVVQQGQPVAIAESPDHGVYGFSHRDASFSVGKRLYSTNFTRQGALSAGLVRHRFPHIDALVTPLGLSFRFRVTELLVEFNVLGHALVGVQRDRGVP